MCRTFTILILLFVITEVNETNAQRMIHDTLFLQRDVRRIAADSFNSQDRIDYSGVFVEKDRSSKSYKYVLNYNFKQITVLGRYRPNSKIDHEAMKEIPSRWYPVTRYHDKFFILSQDAYNKDLLTDTAYIVRSMEGAFSKGLNAFEKINKNTYQLNANTWHDKTFNLRIHVIDTAKALAVFEYFAADDKKHDYRLMVGGNKITEFPLAVSFYRTRNVDDTTWHLIKPKVFMTDHFDAKSLLNKIDEN